jgi:hypothetical protein
VISIGHRSALRALHERHLTVERPEGASRGRLIAGTAAVLGVPNSSPA